jgi:SAM-dependent methyltransferase
VLDCACGIGLLAVGLAERGFDAYASDISPDMIRRTRALAVHHGFDVHARVRAWEELTAPPEYDAVFCVGNSLAHARDRVAALTAMAGVLRPGGLLVLTSRNWDRELAAGTRLEIDDHLTERNGRRALITRAWTIEVDRVRLEIAVSLLDDDSVTTISETLTAWPFTYGLLEAELRGAGLEAEETTYDAEVSRYLVTARNLRER